MINNQRGQKSKYRQSLCSSTFLKGYKSGLITTKIGEGQNVTKSYASQSVGKDCTGQKATKIRSDFNNETF